MQSLMDGLQWRYATKKYDATKRLSDEQFGTILEAARLSPSSYGLEPVRAIVVNTPAVRALLREAGYNQSQFTDASHVVVLAAKTGIDAAYVDGFIERVAQGRGISTDTLAGYSDMIKGDIARRTPESIAAWNARQAYIAMGIMLAMAAEMHIDATPMEGFQPDAFDEILGLKELGLHAIVCVAFGYRAADDALAGAAKVRLPTSQYVIIK